MDCMPGILHQAQSKITNLLTRLGYRSLRQYKRRFSGLKNLKTHEWIAVVEEVRNRATRRIDSEVCLYGRPIDRERLKREVRRYGKMSQTEESRRGNAHLPPVTFLVFEIVTNQYLLVVLSRSCRDRISIRTPLSRSPSPTFLPAPSAGTFASHQNVGPHD